jgi:hypothetical protein
MAQKSFTRWQSTNNTTASLVKSSTEEINFFTLGLLGLLFQGDVQAHKRMPTA